MFHRRGRQMDKYDPGMRRMVAVGGRCGTQTQGDRGYILTNKGVTVYPFCAVCVRLIVWWVIAGYITV